MDAYGKAVEEELHLLLANQEFNRTDWDVHVTGNELLKDSMLLSDRHLH